MQNKITDISQDESQIVKKSEKTFSNCNPYQRGNVFMQGIKQIRANKKINKTNLQPEDVAFKLLTLYEFKNSILSTLNFSEQYRTLVADLSERLQTEHECKTASERSLAHLSAQNYVRTLELQRLIYLEISRSYYNELTTRRLAVLEKAYDRANQQYILTLQALKTAKMPPMNFKLITQNAMFGQNQQVVNEAEPKETVVGEIINAK